MSPERRVPRAGTRADQVYQLLTEGRLNTEISQITGLSPEQVLGSKKYIFDSRYLEHSAEEGAQDRRINLSASRGGVWLALKQDAGLYLTPRQQQMASRVLRKKELSRNQITQAFNQQSIRNGLQRPGQELHREARRDRNRSDGLIWQIICLRRAAAKFVTKNEWPKPMTIREWQLLEVAKVIFEKKPDLIPESLFDCLFLRDFYLARLEYAQTFAIDVLNKFTEDYAKKDPEIFQRLQNQIGYIIKITTTNNGYRAITPAMAGELSLTEPV